MFNEFLDNPFDFQNDLVGDDLNSDVEVNDSLNPAIDSETLDSLQNQINVNPEAVQDVGQRDDGAFGCTDCSVTCNVTCTGTCTGLCMDACTSACQIPLA